MMPSQNFDPESLFLTVLISLQYGLSSVTTVQEDKGGKALIEYLQSISCQTI